MQYRNYSVGTFNTANTCTPICSDQREFPQSVRMPALKPLEASAVFNPGWAASPTIADHKTGFCCAFLCLFVANLLRRRHGLVGFFDAEFFQAILKSAEGEAEEFGGFGDVVVGLLHRLRDQVALDVFEVDSFSRQFERAFRCWSNFLTYFRR